jgi:hypothetical protein
VSTLSHYNDWYYEPAVAQHEARYTCAFIWGGPFGWEFQWYCYSYAPWSDYYGWTYFYNPYQTYYPFRCMNSYHPNYQGPGENNWSYFQNGQWSDPSPAPPFPGQPSQSPDLVPDPPGPPPFNQNQPAAPPP